MIDKKFNQFAGVDKLPFWKREALSRNAQTFDAEKIIIYESPGVIDYDFDVALVSTILWPTYFHKFCSNIVNYTIV